MGTLLMSHPRLPRCLTLSRILKVTPVINVIWAYLGLRFWTKSFELYQYTIKSSYRVFCGNQDCNNCFKTGFLCSFFLREGEYVKKGNLWRRGNHEVVGSLRGRRPLTFSSFPLYSRPPTKTMNDVIETRSTNPYRECLRKCSCQEPIYIYFVIDSLYR